MDPGSAVGPLGHFAIARPPARMADAYDELSCAVRPGTRRGCAVSAATSFGVTVPAAELELVGALRIVESAGCSGFGGAFTTSPGCPESLPDAALASGFPPHAASARKPQRRNDKLNR